MLGDLDEAMKTMYNFHQVWRQFGFTPEYYNIPKAEVHSGREGYPLRPGNSKVYYVLLLGMFCTAMPLLENGGETETGKIHHGFCNRIGPI